MSDDETQKVMWDSRFAETGPKGQSGLKRTAMSIGPLIKRLLGSLTYFDLLAALVVLAMASASLTLAMANRPGWIWNYKDSLGLGLFLCTTLAFILLRRRVSAQRMPWLRVCIATSTVAAGVVLFRRWNGMWVGVGAMILLFALCLRSKTVLEERVREDTYRILLVVGSILFAMILAEGTLRLIPALLSEGARARVLWLAGVNQPWHVSHPYIGHLHNIEHRRMTNATRAKTAQPGKEPARFDVWGFRNTDPWPERVDIITVGDSWTYSLAVNDEQAWPVLLERALAPRRVLNLGLIGGAPQQYLRVYETFGAKLSPTVLLIGLFLGNDLGDELNFDFWWRVESHKGFIESWLKKGRSGVRGWLQKSYLYTLLNDLRASYQAGQFLQEKTVRLTDGGRVRLAPRLLASPARLSSPRQPAFALVLQTLEHLQALATQQQTHCLILFFPSKEEVYLPVLGEAAADLAAPFLPELDKRGIAYLDLGPHFRQRAAAGETLFWEMDSHPNPRGYALIAEVVLAHLQEHAARYGLD